jgi:hypothetical protein
LKINKDWKLIQKQVLKNNKICFLRRNQDMSVVDKYQNDGHATNKLGNMRLILDLSVFVKKEKF